MFNALLGQPAKLGLKGPRVLGRIFCAARVEEVLSMQVNQGQLFGSLQYQYFDRSLRQVRGHMPIKAQAVFLSALDGFRAFLTNGDRLSAATE